MKKYFLLLAILIFVFSCSQKKNPTAKEKVEKYQVPLNQNEHVEKLEDEGLKPFTIKKVFNLKPNLTITINENHSDGYWGICDIDIILKSIDKVKNISINESDPIDTFFVADLNKDNIEELYIEIRTTGSGAYANLIGFTLDSLNNINQIDFSELSNNVQDDDQYAGHDSYYPIGNLLIHEYPLYDVGDANCCPSAGRKENIYELFQNEGEYFVKKINSKIIPPSSN